jgi:hypothetical protein
VLRIQNLIMPKQTTRFCLLPETAIIEIRGTDAQRFLQAQLGIDVMTLSGNRAPLGGWHNPRGRLRALLRIVRLDSSWLLLLPRSQQANILNKLAMYVLRADVQLNGSTQLRVAALLGDASAWLAKYCPGLEAEASAIASAGDASCIRLGAQLYQLVGTQDALTALTNDLETGTEDEFGLAEIEMGVPSVEAAVAEQYLPQMLNLDLLGAMSFNKGCYPGQEVVARTHNLGSVKRRMRRFAASAGIHVIVGENIESQDGAVVGNVLSAAQDGERTQLLAVVRLEALGAPLLVRGAPLQELPLPY